jgi:hypothetical protein
MEKKLDRGCLHQEVVSGRLYGYDPSKLATKEVCYPKQKDV